MNVFTLQITAMLTMLIDHIGEYFLADYLPFRCIGRFAFIVYAFLFAEGFRHYKDDRTRVSEHLRFYIILAIVSEVCYDIADNKIYSLKAFISSQSVIITLLLAFLGLLAMDRWKKRPVNVSLAVILTSLLTYLLRSNYRMMGVILVYMFYVYLNYFEEKPYTRRLAELLVIMLVYIPMLFWAMNDFCSPGILILRLNSFTLWFYGIQILVPFILAAYKGKQGFKSPAFKIIYRWFYPAHLLVIGIVTHLRQ